MQLDFRLLADTRCGVGESPVWDDRRKVLFFVDIKAPAVHAVHLDGSGLKTWQMPTAVGSVGLGQSGRLVVALERAIAVLDPDSGALSTLAEVSEEPATNRLNDGKVGPDGAFWVGSMDERPQKEPIGSLYRVDGNGRVTCVIRHGFQVSNGLAWSPDGKAMFHSDSAGSLGQIATRSIRKPANSATGSGSSSSTTPPAGRMARRAMRRVPIGAPACPPGD